MEESDNSEKYTLYRNHNQLFIGEQIRWFRLVFCYKVMQYNSAVGFNNTWQNNFIFIIITYAVDILCLCSRKHQLRFSALIIYWEQSFPIRQKIKPHASSTFCFMIYERVLVEFYFLFYSKYKSRNQLPSHRTVCSESYLEFKE